MPAGTNPFSLILLSKLKTSGCWSELSENIRYYNWLKSLPASGYWDPDDLPDEEPQPENFANDTC